MKTKFTKVRRMYGDEHEFTITVKQPSVDFDEMYRLFCGNKEIEIKSTDKIIENSKKYLPSTCELCSDGNSEENGDITCRFDGFTRLKNAPYCQYIEDKKLMNIETGILKISKITMNQITEIFSLRRHLIWVYDPNDYFNKLVQNNEFGPINKIFQMIFDKDQKIQFIEGIFANNLIFEFYSKEEMESYWKECNFDQYKDLFYCKMISNGIYFCENT